MTRPFKPNGIVTFLTDFGTQDAYVGAMKGVVLQHDRNLKIHDLSHAVPPQNVRHGAFVLRDLLPHFPAGTVHCCVVDPGVGTDRSALILQIRDQLVVAPDNGLISWLGLKPTDPVFHVPPTKPENLSSTFHGRDLFAPAAARLASGALTLNQLQLFSTTPVLFPWSEAKKTEEGGYEGEVVCIDSFGNCITNLAASLLAPCRKVEVESTKNFNVKVVSTYGDAESGNVVALVGSSGWVEIAVVNGNAAVECELSCKSAIRFVY